MTNAIRDFYQQDAENYDERRWLTPSGQQAAYDSERLIEDALRDHGVNGRVLEIGCGSGRITEKVVARASETVLVDISSNMLEIAKARALKAATGSVTTHVGSAYELPLETNSVDAVVSINVLSHIEQPLSFLTETARVVRPGGTVVLNFPIWNSLFLPAALLVKARKRAFNFNVYSRWYSSREVKGLFKHAGMSIDQTYGQYYVPRAVDKVDASKVLRLINEQARTGTVLSKAAAPALLVVGTQTTF